MPHAIRQGDIPGVQLRCDRRFDRRSEEIWAWLVEGDRLGRWIAEEVEARDEGWRFEGRDETGRRLSEELRELARDEGRRLVFVFERLDDDWENATRLILEVSETRPAELSIVQQGFERLSLSRCLTVWELYRRRWRTSLERLAAALDAESAL